MNDRDEVIRELQTEIENAIYPDRPRRFMFPLWLAEKVLELLKAQEPVEPSWRRGIPFCGKCGRQFGRGFKYCPDCGRAVKWE